MNAKRNEDDANKHRGDASWEGIDHRRQTATSGSAPLGALMPEEPGTVEGALRAFDIITRKFTPPGYTRS